MKIVLLLAILLALLVFTGSIHAPPPLPVHIFSMSDHLFLENNPDLFDGLPAMAEMLCINDKAKGVPSGEQWRAAAAQCVDSYRDDDHESRDGGWRDYSFAALRYITDICQGRSDLYVMCRLYFPGK